MGKSEEYGSDDEEPRVRSSSMPSPSDGRISQVWQKKKRRTSDEQECKLNDALCTICKLSDQDENLAQVEWLAMRFTHSANLLAP